MTPAGVETLRTQVRWLAGVIAAAMVLMFLAVALPWAVRMIDVELAPLAWTLTAFAVVHAALVIGADRVLSPAVMLRLLYAVPLTGIAFMALLWHHGGGAGHPVLALAMVLPVMAAAALPRPRFAYDVALYSIVVVTLAVALASADFAWYAAQLGVPGATLVRLAGDEILAHDPFPGATTTPAATFLFVATFALLQLAAAAIATRVAQSVRRREELALRLDAPVADTLATAALHTTPAAALTVIAGTGQIVQASRRFIHQMLLHNEPIVGRELLGVLAFEDEERVRRVLAEGGVLTACRYRVGAEERTATLAAETFEHEGMQYASVLLDDEPQPGAEQQP
ncbi:MAG TPA: hypothetical protein VGF69_14425 [Thermoanaerobaculia bacterium]|jgi:hypothetical protein